MIDMDLVLKKNGEKRQSFYLYMYIPELQSN